MALRYFENVSANTLCYASFAGGESQGFYAQTGANVWNECNATGEIRFSFNEGQRTHEGVVLFDPSRGVSIQIDLRRGVILFRDSTSPWRDLYGVTKAASVDGWLVRSVLFSYGVHQGNGAYEQTPSGWIERSDGQNKPRFHFNEQSRDLWSVYLNDPSSSVDIQIDLWRGKIRFADPNTPLSDLYDVLDATSF
jgi:hypothetical protein